MEATVVRETTTADGRNIKEMSDGRILVSNTNRSQGTMYGIIAGIEGEATDEKLAKAKEEVVDKVCALIREIAKERDDFFIIKPPFYENGLMTVAHKFILPTVEEDGLARTGEDIIVIK